MVARTSRRPWSPRLGSSGSWSCWLPRQSRLGSRRDPCRPGCAPFSWGFPDLELELAKNLVVRTRWGLVGLVARTSRRPWLSRFGGSGSRSCWPPRQSRLGSRGDPRRSGCSFSKGSGSVDYRAGALNGFGPPGGGSAADRVVLLMPGPPRKFLAERCRNSAPRSLRGHGKHAYIIRSLLTDRSLFTDRSL